MKYRNPEYTARYDRGEYYQCDSIPALSIRLEDDGVILFPEEVKAEILTKYGESVFIYDDIQLREDGYLILGALGTEITSEFEPGLYSYQVKFKLGSNPRVRTYLTGSLTILRGRE